MFQQIDATVMILLKWQNEFVSWDPTDYDQLQQMKLWQTDSWIPQLSWFLYNVKAAQVKLHEKAGKFTCSFAGRTSGVLHVVPMQVI